MRLQGSRIGGRWRRPHELVVLGVLVLHYRLKLIKLILFSLIIAPINSLIRRLLVLHVALLGLLQVALRGQIVVVIDLSAKGEHVAL